MIKVTLTKPIRGTPSRETVDVEIPALPRAGDHLEHEPSGISGTVDQCIFWWDGKGTLSVFVVLA